MSAGQNPTEVYRALWWAWSGVAATGVMNLLAATRSGGGIFFLIVLMVAGAAQLGAFVISLVAGMWTRPRNAYATSAGAVCSLVLGPVVQLFGFGLTLGSLHPAPLGAMGLSVVGLVFSGLPAAGLTASTRYWDRRVGYPVKAMRPRVEILIISAALLLGTAYGALAVHMRIG